MNEKLYYVLLSEDNRITMLTVEKQNEEQVAFEFPQDFNVSDIINYKIVDGELVYDEYVYPEVEPQPSGIDILYEIEADQEFRICCLEMGITPDEFE